MWWWSSTPSKNFPFLSRSLTLSYITVQALLCECWGQDIKKSSILKNLDIIWQHVVESNIPPSDQQLTIGTCLITGKTNLPCIVIRGKGRGANNFTVSSKFSLFLYHLWIIYKIDILIKVCLLFGLIIRL